MSKNRKGDQITKKDVSQDGKFEVSRNLRMDYSQGYFQSAWIVIQNKE